MSTPEASPAARVIRFGVFEADLAASELRKSGVRIRLQDQPFQILTLLLERPGEVVSREEIRQRLWPADTFVDFEHGLNTSIKRLRQALSDSATQPCYIETLPRVGYRFIAPVEKAQISSHQPASPKTSEAPISTLPAAILRETSAP